jgi:NADP-dependent 3-hydroxy acid dehydrogenase YdfG
MPNTTSQPRVWFITGCSTGFGRSLAEAVLAHGNYLIATARKPEQLSDLVEQYPTGNRHSPHRLIAEH